MKAVSKVLVGAVCFVGGYAALSAGLYIPAVIKEASKKHRDSCDYLLILGSNVIGAETPCGNLLARINAAAEYLNEHNACVAVPCGSCFRPGQKKSEAQIIAEHLTALGVEENRIIPEDKSTTTFENFEFARKIIEAHAGKDINSLNVAFLTSSYHVFRAAAIAKLCGIENMGKVSCPTGADMPQRLAREYIVAHELLYKLIKNKITKQN